MKLYFALPILIVCLVLVSCSDDNNNPMTDNGNQEPFEITSEIEYAVYRAVIEEMYVHDERKLIVIESQTFFNPDYVIGAFEYPDILNVSPETLDSFQKRNQQHQAIDCKKLALSVCVTSATQTPVTKYLLTMANTPGTTGIAFTKNILGHKALWRFLGLDSTLTEARLSFTWKITLMT